MNFYEDLNKKIGNYIKSLTSDKDQIDEVTQEALIKIHKSIDTLQDEEKLTSWLKRIVYTSLMDYHRKQQKLYSAEWQETAEMESDNNEGNEALMQCVTTLLRTLPAEQRELLEAVELKGISQTQYANERNVAVSTVKSRVQRAKLKIKEQIMNNCVLKLDSYGNVVDYRLPQN